MTDETGFYAPSMAHNALPSRPWPGISEAAEVLSKLKEDYGENYRTYKGMAFLEAAKQSAMPKESRNYEKFGEYYKKAQELYLAQLDNNVNDMEMQRLEELYDQAVQNGWLN